MEADFCESMDVLIKEIIGLAYQVSNGLGAGFLKKVYEKALVAELRYRNLAVRTQVPFRIQYRDEVVGEYIADMTVEEKIIVELKCVQGFNNLHTAQCINYLKASGLKVALLLNFQFSRMEWKRIVYGL